MRAQGRRIGARPLARYGAWLMVLAGAGERVASMRMWAKAGSKPPPLRAAIDNTAGLGPMVIDGYPGLDPGGQLGQGAHVHAEPFPPRRAPVSSWADHRMTLSPAGSAAGS